MLELILILLMGLGPHHHLGCPGHSDSCPIVRPVD